ncbi:MAG: hypothetical protein NXY57DRAFT_1012601 [Lentinula lateritia]|nr:MAG: hypothetical protein NXY57DRAFT_1012601 [Lentinula lateritia]
MWFTRTPFLLLSSLLELSLRLKSQFQKIFPALEYGKRSSLSSSSDKFSYRRSKFERIKNEILSVHLDHPKAPLPTVI